MQIVDVHTLIERGPFSQSEEWRALRQEVLDAIREAEWPVGSGTFTIHPQSGKKRGEGNGVKPLKDKTMLVLCDGRRYGEMGKAAKDAAKKAEKARVKSETAATLAERADDAKSRAKAEKAQRVAEQALALADEAAGQFARENTGCWIGEYPWPIGERVLPGNMDAAYALPDGGMVAFEWETGNVFLVKREGSDACLNVNPRAIPQAA